MGQAIFQDLYPLALLLNDVFEGGTIFGYFTERRNHILIEGRLLARQHIHIGLFEIAEQFAFDPGFCGCEPPLRNIGIMVRQLLQPVSFTEISLNLLENFGTRSINIAGRFPLNNQLERVMQFWFSMPRRLKKTGGRQILDRKSLVVGKECRL